MRAARSASPRITSRPRRALSSAGRFGEPLGPRQDRGERVVQLVRDAGDGLAERRHLLGLQQLVVQVARLVLELLAIAHVADQGLDADASSPTDSALAVTSIQTSAPSFLRSRSR